MYVFTKKSKFSLGKKNTKIDFVVAINQIPMLSTMS